MNDPRAAGGTGHPLLSYAFRPFFLAAALWAALAIGLWIGMLTTELSLPSRFDPLDWHIHAMLFGFVPAAIAGFLLTAGANWTGREPVSGAPLALLVILWSLARLVQLIGAWLPLGVVIGTDLAFPIALTGTVAHELIAARNRRNYPMIVPLVVLTVAQLLMDLAAEGGFPSLAGYGWRLGLAAALILISVLGARIVPSFTRNWLLARHREPPPASGGLLERAAHALMPGALMAWAFLPQARWVGVLLVGGAVLNLWRLMRWRGMATREEALLLVLHVGYAWLVVGVGMLGIATLTPAFPLAAAIHALTAGAIGTMILAVMTRVSRGHTGRTLTADRATIWVYALVVLAAAVRIAAALAARAQEDLLIASALLWIGAFGLFALRYAPLLLRPRPTG